MNFKQYFYQDDKGSRINLEKIPNLSIKADNIFVIGLEFEPEHEYNPILFKKGIYKACMKYEVPGEKQRIKFKFRVRERNLIALEDVKVQAKKEKRILVISFPIII